MNGAMMKKDRWLMFEAVSVQANSRSDVKQSDRSQNRRLLKGLSA
jgi:hypothetical protein